MDREQNTADRQFRASNCAGVFARTKYTNEISVCVLALTESSPCHDPTRNPRNGKERSEESVFSVERAAAQ